MPLKIIKLISVLLFCIAGCAGSVGKQVDWSDPAIDKVWPAAPETARIRLLRTFGADDMIASDRQQHRLFRWVVGEGTEVIPLVTPYGVATDGQGVIWVTDPGNSLVHIFDLVRGRVDYMSTVGQFHLQTPSGIYFDSIRQHLFVVDSTLRRVFQLDRRGAFIREFGGPDIFQRPAGLALDRQGNLLVADVLAGVVHRFSPSGKLLLALGSSLTEDGFFNHPLSVAVDPQGDIYVIDSLNFCVEILDSEGKSVGSIGSLGDMPGTFSRPRGLAIDTAGRIYVSDAAFDNIQIFNKQGQLLMYFGRDRKWPLSLPAGLTIDATGRIIVADSLNHRLMIYQLLSTGRN